MFLKVFQVQMQNHLPFHHVILKCTAAHVRQEVMVQKVDQTVVEVVIRARTHVEIQESLIPDLPVNVMDYVVLLQMTQMGIQDQRVVLEVLEILQVDMDNVVKRVELADPTTVAYQLIVKLPSGMAQENLTTG